MNTVDAKRVLEAVLFCAQQPVASHELLALLSGLFTATSLQLTLEGIQQEWSARSVELVHVASGWRFQSRPEICGYVDQLGLNKLPRYSRATLETLAVIAYRQPVSRGDIERIRGVAIASQLLKQLEDRGWIEVVGHRDSIGRPAIYATTCHFLDDLGIDSLAGLPFLTSADLQLTKVD